jgi:hypothetical protein
LAKVVLLGDPPPACFIDASTEGRIDWNSFDNYGITVSHDLALTCAGY